MPKPTEGWARRSTDRVMLGSWGWWHGGGCRWSAWPLAPESACRARWASAWCGPLPRHSLAWAPAPPGSSGPGSAVGMANCSIVFLILLQFCLYTLLIPFGKFGPPYPGKATAAAIAALPSPTSARWVFSYYHNPANSDMDYRISNMCTRSFLAIARG